MITTDRGHPDYQFDGELLAVLPVAPWFVPLPLVCSDLQCTGHHVRHSIDRLLKTGIRIARKGADLAIARESIADARIVANDYVFKVYGE